jgi:hypothetical protein
LAKDIKPGTLGAPFEDTKPDLGTPAEVAEYLRKIPEHTLAQWRSQGIGPEYIKAGRHVLYRWSKVKDWLDQQSNLTGRA